MNKKIKKLLKSNAYSHLFFTHIKNVISKCRCILISDEKFIKQKYYSIHKKELNLTNPQSFNEKIQWLKLNYRKEILTTCTDKYAVREYVRNILGKEILNELYFCYDNVEDINFSLLPDQFVMKVTHGSGQNLITTNKHHLNWSVEKKLLNLYMLSNHYLEGREWQYKNIPPRIICEKYLTENEKPPVDYKFFCFNGIPTFIQLDLDRFENHTQNMYDTDWNLLPFRFRFENGKDPVEKPDKLNKMLEYAEKIAKGFPFVRVDFYCVEGKVIFGELTFHPAQGVLRFKPEAYDRQYGELLTLPKKE
jgi:hypothetical protein